MMAVEKQKRFKAIVVHGKPSFYEENSLARTLADRGVDVSRVYFTTFAQNAKRQDWRGVDLAVLLTSSVDRNVAKAVRDLAEYEEWLRKLAAGGELTGRAMAWVNLALVLCAMLVPILLRHGALPENMAAMLGNIFATADQLATDAQAA